MIELTVLERVILFGILPRQGSFNEMDIAQGIINQIHFPPQERDQIGLKDQGGTVIWDNEKESEHTKEVEFGVAGLALVHDTLTSMSEKNELPIDALSLWRKFCSPGPKIVEQS
jgi:hypothetical protein